MINNKRSVTSSFGVSKRINHDSSKFYNQKIYSNIELKKVADISENSPYSIDHIYCKSSENMDDLPNDCVHLMVTSPPYNVSKEYDNDLSLEEYRDIIRNVLKETFRVLVNGGRACINIANIGRKPYIPLHSFLIQDMLDIGFLMRGEVIWNKSASSGVSTAWGSWQSASNPTLRDTHEYILIFSKGDFSRKTDKKNTITKDEFLEYTKSLWNFPAESAQRIGHPAPFPLELPYRLIQLYSFQDDIVLDPFCGSGTTCLAAIKSKRHYIGYEISQKYVELCNQRLESTKTLF